VYASNLVRYYEDSTFVSAATSPTETPAQHEAGMLSPAKVASMTGCGVNLLGFDQILPDDGRLAATVWSWADGQPSARTGSCAIERPDGRWMTAACSGALPAVCRTAGGSLVVTGPVAFAGAPSACRAAGGVFDLPRTGLENSRLHAQLAGGPAWLDYRLA
jgi:hypothetical protein